jgi:hypothetical protein
MTEEWPKCDVKDCNEKAIVVACGMKLCGAHTMKIINKRREEMRKELEQ